RPPADSQELIDHREGRRKPDVVWSQPVRQLWSSRRLKVEPHMRVDHLLAVDGLPAAVHGDLEVWTELPDDVLSPAKPDQKIPLQVVRSHISSDVSIRYRHRLDRDGSKP